MCIFLYVLRMNLCTNVMQWAQKAFDAWYLADFIECTDLRTGPAVSNSPSVTLPFQEYSIVKTEWLGTL